MSSGAQEDIDFAIWENQMTELPWRTRILSGYERTMTDEDEE